MHPILAVPILVMLVTGTVHAAVSGCPDAVGWLLEAARLDPALALTAAQHQRLVTLASETCRGQTAENGSAAAAPASQAPSLLDALTRETEKTAGHERLERLKR